MKVKIYTVRQSHYAGKWITEAPRGNAVQHDSKEAAEKYAWKRAEKIIYTLPMK
jgi:hypothetical protein